MKHLVNNSRYRGLEATMLIDFTVENYRSIKEPVTLSAVAQHRPKSRPRDVESPAASARRLRVVPDDEIAAPFPVPGHDFELLPVLAIFGANASGKSNVLRALDASCSYLKPASMVTKRRMYSGIRFFRLEQLLRIRPNLRQHSRQPLVRIAFATRPLLHTIL